MVNVFYCLPDEEEWFPTNSGDHVQCAAADLMSHWSLNMTEIAEFENCTRGCVRVMECRTGVAERPDVSIRQTVLFPTVACG